MKIENFEDIEAWKESRILVTEIYSYFKNNKDYGFRDQIQRAAISIMSNIAEGFDRESNKEFIRFLIISKGSVSELKSLTYAALDLKYIKEERSQNIVERCTKIIKLLNGFIRYLRKSGRK